MKLKLSCSIIKFLQCFNFRKKVLDTPLKKKLTLNGWE